MSVPDRSRYTSPIHAGARFVAQRGLLKPLIWRLATVTVLGRENLADLHGPFVVVSNHTSHLDAPLIIGALPRRLARYVAAGAAADYFFDVWWRRGLTSLFFNAFPVDRTGLRGKRGMATSLLDDGVPLLLFPEGTRSRTGEMGSFKPGAAASASAGTCPVYRSASSARRPPCRGVRTGPNAAGRRSTSPSAHRCTTTTAKPPPRSRIGSPKR